MTKEKGKGNFVSLPNGDIASARPISKHAQQRIKQRGSSTSGALKGTHNSGAIISDDGKVITVIPEPWKKNAGMIQRKNKVKSDKASVSFFKVPDEQSLPNDHCILSLSIPPSVLGLILGKQHSSIKKMTNKCPGTYYVMNDNIITVWGPETNAKRLIQDIESRLDDVDGVIGPPVPEEKLPPGQCKRRILIANYNIGHVLGKGKQNLVKLREDNPTASINFSSKTGEMYVFGEIAGVDKVCDEVALIVDTAKQMRAKENARKERVGKASHDKKTRQHEDDKHAFQMAVSLQGIKETAELATTLKKMQDKAIAKLCQKH